MDEMSPLRLGTRWMDMFPPSLEASVASEFPETRRAR
jgi:hypothetical protein